MSPKLTAFLVGLVASLCFWLAYVVGLAGVSFGSFPQLLEGYLLIGSFDRTVPLGARAEAAPLALWAVALLGYLILRTKSPKVALVLSIIAPVCGLAGAASELLQIHLGITETSILVLERQPMWLYAPRLTATVFMVGITLLGLSIQLLFGPTKPGGHLGEAASQP